MYQVLAPGLNSQIESFLSRQANCSRCAFVVPTYEIKSTVARLPENKTELLRLVRRGKARQFHQVVYSINQKSSNLKRWEKIPQVHLMTIALFIIFSIGKTPREFSLLRRTSWT